MKKWLAVIVIVLISAILIGEEETPQATDVVAVVNGTVITSDQLNREAGLERILAQVKSIDERFFQTLTTTSEGLNALLRYKREVLNSLIDQVLIKQIGESLGITVSKEEIEEMVSNELNATLQQYGMTESDLDWYLKQSGLGDLESFKEGLRWILSVRKIVTDIQESVTSEATVTEQDAQQYYDDNKDAFAYKDSVKLLRIVVNTEEDANAALERIRSGEDFTAVASDVSIDPLTKDKAGDMGWVEKNTGLIKEDLEDKIFNAPKGAILGPFQVSSGWEIYRVVDKQLGGYRPFEEVSQNIVDYLLQQQKLQMWQNWLTQQFQSFKDSSEIKIYLMSSEESNE